MTVEFTVKHNKPCLKLHPGIKGAGQKLRDFVSDSEIQTRNVAEPRASKEPEVGDFVKQAQCSWCDCYKGSLTAFAQLRSPERVIRKGFTPT